MNLRDWLSLADDARRSIEQLRSDKKILQQLLAAKDVELLSKDQIIAALQEQLQTASVAMFANEGELTLLQNKFDELSRVVTPPDT